MKSKSGIFCMIFMSVMMHTQSQPVSIGKGWAQNSVNAPVFRKNSVTSFQGTQYAAYYDSLGNVILAKRQLGTEVWETYKTQHTGDITDAHCCISIGVDGDGYLHMAWDHHNDALRYCMATDSGSLVMGAKTSMIGNSEDDVTYPEFFRMPNGDLIFVYRYGVSGAGNMVINKYVLAEKKWIRLHDILIDGEGDRNAYWQCFVDVNGIIHVSWVWRDTWDVSTNHDMCYAKSTDGGITWQKSTGVQYTIPITAATAEYAWIISTSNELINQTSMYATSDGKPYIATYWKESVTKKPQYQLIYLDDNMQWQRKTLSDRLTTFTLSGGGTKKIPISRPQIMVDERGAKPVVYLLYRDSERESKVSVNVCHDISPDTVQWQVYDVTDFSVNSWEPSFDIDLWKDSSILDIFVQKMGQGDGETLEDLPAQPVYIWRFSDTLKPADTISTPVIIPGLAESPIPATGSVEINTDTVLTWSPGENAITHRIYFDTQLTGITFREETTDTFYILTGLLPGTRYYWRIDEVNGDHITTGKNWYFKTVTVQAVYSIQDNVNAVRIYPQPVRNILYIHNIKNEELVEIFDLSGNMLFSVVSIGSVDVSQLSGGVYIVKTQGGYRGRFIKID